MLAHCQRPLGKTRRWNTWPLANRRGVMVLLCDGDPMGSLRRTLRGNGCREVVQPD
jgi:hypothetical protein